MATTSLPAVDRPNAARARQNEDSLKSEYYLKNEDNLKMKSVSKIKTTQKSKTPSKILLQLAVWWL